MLLFAYIGGTHVFTLLVIVLIGLSKTKFMNVEVETNVETQILSQLVDWFLFEPKKKKATENHQMLLFTYIGGTYVFTLLVSVPIGLCKTIMNVEVETNVETQILITEKHQM